tara:strand:- start:260 stop:1033 length:774 start_codon:yes stop_codon:yes gene_type:complete
MIQDEIYYQIFLTIVSIFSNFISALSGGGAGLIQLPALLFIGLPFPNALATHKVASVALGLGASIPHFKRNKLQKEYAIILLISGLPGVLIGSYFAYILPSDYSTSLLGILTLLLCFYSVMNKRLGMSNKRIILTKSKIIFGSLGLFIIAFLNGYLSSGTGLFVTFWMISIFKLSFSVAVAYTLIFVGIFWNGFGAISLGLSGNIIWSYVPLLIIGSILGGYFGAYLSILKGSIFIKVVFEIISFMVAISLLIKAFL